jgi:hypothetical protein
MLITACCLWSHRYYKERYDARSNLVDWDFSMKLHEKAPIINNREYLRWRYMYVCTCVVCVCVYVCLCMFTISFPRFTSHGCHNRNTGVAFELREAEYNVPNRTLASGRIFNTVVPKQHFVPLSSLVLT